jgi:hypothetical protein
MDDHRGRGRSGPAGFIIVITLPSPGRHRVELDVDDLRWSITESKTSRSFSGGSW